MARPLRRPILIALLFATVALAGCAGTNRPASVKGGECRLFERPEYAIYGKTQFDQDWIDGNIEAGVGGCEWKRPLPRTDTSAPPSAQVRSSPKKRPGLVSRIKARIGIAAPVTVVPIPVAAPDDRPAPAPADPLDDLLGQLPGKGN